MYELLHGVGPFEGPPDTTPTTREIYERVTSHTTLSFSESELAPCTVDLINQLVYSDQSERLNAAGIKDHPFFKGVTWGTLHESKAPFIPELGSSFDVSFFEEVGPPTAPSAPPTPMRRAAATSGIGALAPALPFLGYGFVSPRVTTDRSGDTPRAMRYIRRLSSIDHRQHRPSSSLSQGSSSSLFNRQDSTEVPASSDGEAGSARVLVPALSPPSDSTRSDLSKPRRRVSFNYDVIFLDAAKSGQLATVQEMVEKCNVPVEKRTATGLTALCLSAINGHADVLKYLIDRGAAVNVRCSDGCTPLHLAVLEERPEIVRLLLKNGADKAAKTPEGETAEDWAEECDEILQVLNAS